jgi:hypothetical protein
MDKNWKYELMFSQVNQSDFIENFDEIVRAFESPKLSSLEDYMHLMYNSYKPNEEVFKNVSLKLHPWLRVGNRPKEIELIIKLKNKEDLFELLK